jgi:hypothetical protein
VLDANVAELSDCSRHFPSPIFQPILLVRLATNASGQARTVGQRKTRYFRDKRESADVGERGVGGGGGIRTRDTVSRIHTFQACAFNHSATPPVARTIFMAAQKAIADYGKFLMFPRNGLRPPSVALRRASGPGPLDPGPPDMLLAPHHMMSIPGSARRSLERWLSG